MIDNSTTFLNPPEINLRNQGSIKDLLGLNMSKLHSMPNTNKNNAIDKAKRKAEISH